MSYRKEGRSYDCRPLGYDLRMVGVRADADRLQRRLYWRPNLIPASYDNNVSRPMLVSSGDVPEPFQTEIDPRQVSDPYFTTFGLFRSSREAISFIHDRNESRDFQLWYFSLIWPQHPPAGIFSGILQAMQGEDVLVPDLPTERLGYEVLDSDGASVTHTYYDVDDISHIDIARLGEESDRLASEGDWLIAIDRVMHPWWLPDR